MAGQLATYVMRGDPNFFLPRMSRNQGLAAQKCIIESNTNEKRRRTKKKEGMKEGKKKNGSQ